MQENTFSQIEDKLYTTPILFVQLNTYDINPFTQDDTHDNLRKLYKRFTHCDLSPNLTSEQYTRLYNVLLGLFANAISNPVPF